jgi:uncharacterized damage-inducible protein DinB
MNEHTDTDRRNGDRRTTDRRMVERRRDDMPSVVGSLKLSLSHMQRVRESIEVLLGQEGLTEETRQQLESTREHVLSREAQVLKEIEALTRCFNRELKRNDSDE